MRAGVERERAERLVHKGATGEHAGFSDDDERVIRRSVANAGGGVEGCWEIPREGDYIAWERQEKGRVKKARTAGNLTQRPQREEHRGRGEAEAQHDFACE